MVAEAPQWNTLEQMKHTDCACPWVSREQAHKRLLDTEVQTLRMRCDGRKDVQGTHGKMAVNTQLVDELSHPDEVDKGGCENVPTEDSKEKGACWRGKEGMARENEKGPETMAPKTRTAYGVKCCWKTWMGE